MATRKELEEKLAAARAQRAALEDDIFAIDQQQNPNVAFMGPEIRMMDQIAKKRAIQPVLHRGQFLDRQIRELVAEINKGDRDDRYAAAAQERTIRATAQAQKAQKDAAKARTDNLEDASARAFGIGKGKGIDYLTKRKGDLFYDPARGQIAVPPEKPADVSEKTTKGDPQALKDVQSRLNQFTKKADIQGSLNPASFFDKDGFTSTVETDKDGKQIRVYDADGTPVSIPEDIVPQLQKKYDAHFPTTASGAPQTGIKYIPVNTFQQANQALNELTGESNISPADRFVQSQTMNRQANQALQGAPQFSGPTTTAMGQPLLAAPKEVPALNFPATASYPAEVTGAVTPTRTLVPSIAPGPDINTAFDRSPTAGQFGAALLAGADPSFLNYAANREAARIEALRGARQVTADEGASGSVKDLAKFNKEAVDAGAKTPQQRNAFIRGRVDQQQSQDKYFPTDGEDVPTVIANAASNAVGVAAPAVRSGYNYLTATNDLINPVNPGFFTKYAKPVLESAGQRALSVMRSGMSVPAPDDIAKKYFAAKGSNEIGPDVTLEDFAQLYNPTNATGTPELQVP